MAKKKKTHRVAILESTEGTGCRYYYKVNAKMAKLELSKYDWVLRKTCVFKEVKK